jgi:DNA-3-methyladenine glycosylase
MSPHKTREEAHSVRRLRRAELPADTIALARYLIGKTIIVEDSREGPGEARKKIAQRMAGRIVETEAYPIGDAAGHAFRGLTPGNRSLFLERGHAYVYFTYGSSFMLNVSAEASGVGAGVLVRAVEPLEGIARMKRNRGTARVHDLTRGPGRLAAAFRIDKRFDGIDLCAAGPIWLGTGKERSKKSEVGNRKRTANRNSPEIGVSVRIGINRQTRRPWRFYERGNPFVSGPKWLSR